MQQEKKKPFLTVIMTVYSAEKYIRPSIESILRQTYTNIQIILIDDGTPDRCGEICDEYAKQDERILVIHQKNAGVINARKNALKQATGEYITFVDPDDMIPENMYADMYEAVKDDNADIVVTGFTYLYPDGTTEVYQDKLPSGLYNREMIEKKILPVMMTHGKDMKRGLAPALFKYWYRKSIIEQVLPDMIENIVNGTDAACTYTCMLKSNVVRICAEMSHYLYRISPTSESKRYNPNWYVSASSFCRWMDQVYEACGNEMLKETFVLEKFYQFYRYIDREFTRESKTVAQRIETMQMVTNIPEIKKTLQEVNVDALTLSYFQRKEYKAFQNGKCKKAYFYWKLAGVYARLRHRIKG